MMLVTKKIISMIPDGASLSFQLLDDIDSINEGMLGSDIRKIYVDNSTRSIYMNEKHKNSTNGILVHESDGRYMIISDYLELADGDVFSDKKFNFLELGAIDTHRVISMHSMFKNCWAECIDMTGWVTKQVKDTSEMFESANIGSFELDLSGFDLSSIVNMHAMFRNSVIRNSIIIPSRGLHIGASIQDISNMFDYSDLRLSNNKIVLQHDVIGSDELGFNSAIDELIIEVLE